MRPLIMGCAKPALSVVPRIMITVMRSAQKEVRMEGVFEEDSVVEVTTEEEGLSSHVEHVSTMDLQNITN
ncbi:hypothetical protein KI387_031574, partial [Taxus chinensis]